ncbi:MAG: site-specific DNA-methyltransferase [Syntrophomonadaceae bacterium]|nr:site-specific DNA-methyltransferase [Syntrophomonadaceae bacterium]
MTNQQPEKLAGTSLDIPAENRSQLKLLFPSVFTETKNAQGEIIESIDFEKLKAELGTFSDLFENRRERYGMDWPGKKEALRLIQTPSRATLKPCREESVNFDTTENLFIEGDNLEVLKLLQKSYYGKVKMIYIDPPYNTGKEFIYPDNYAEDLQTYLQYAGLIDGDGKKFSTNTANEGRFHTKWMNMMYPRLYLARNLLKDDGVIFVSIGQIEFSNLINIMNDVFGEYNRISVCTRLMKTGGQKGKFFSPNTDYVLIYAKSIDAIDKFRDELSYELISKVYTQIQEDGPRKGEKYREMGLFQPTLDIRANQRYYINCPDGEFVIPPGNTFPEHIVNGEKIKPINGDGVWRWTYERYCDELAKGNILFKKTSTSPLITAEKNQSNWNIYTKIWLSDRIMEGKLPLDMFDKFENRHSAQELNKLAIPFDFAKPSELISYLAGLCGTEDSDIVLDFFSGSATTAHAILDMDKQDGGNRKFIMIQLPEPCAEDSEAFRAGYKTIADIGKERIRRVIKKLNNEQEGKLDLENAKGQDRGFRVFKLDQSNFKQWNTLSPTTTTDKIIEQLELHIDHISETASQEDLLFEILLKAGFMPTAEAQEHTFAGKKVFSIAEGALLICLEDTVSKELIDAVIASEPMQFICLDAAFHGNDQLKANAVQTFAAHNMQKEKHNQIIFRTI